MNTAAETRIATPTRNHAIFTACFAVLALVFWRTLFDLAEYSLHHESSSHILLIPFITAYLLYQEKSRLFSESRVSALPGLSVIVLGVGLRLLTERFSPLDGNEHLSLAMTSFVVILIGAFILAYGLRAARAGMFPLLFLFFAVPLPDPFLDRTIYLLQTGSTDVTCWVFRILGVPVLRQGFVLTTPGVTIEVAKECSGIRSSMALLITCLLAGYLFLRTGWKILLFAMISLPFAIVKNGIRIATLTLLSVYVDPSFLTGHLHHDGGFVFFLLTLALLFPIFLALERSERARPGKNIPVQT